MHPISSPRENDIFVCYAPEDLDWVKPLEKALREQKRDPWIDWEDIPDGIEVSTPEAQLYIEAGIKNVDIFVFVISKNSITSERNRAELDLAAQLKKRLVPVLIQSEVNEPIPDTLIPDALRDKSNWLSIDLQNDPNHSIVSYEQLAKNIVHIHIHTRLLAKAIEWQNRGKSSDLLLRQIDLDSTNDWFAQNPDKKPKLTPLQKEYLKNPKPNQPEIFISYSRRDRASFVEQLCNRLKDAGFNIWVDWENIPVAANWRDEIKEGIKSAHTFLFMMSGNSVKSDNCSEEIKIAEDLNKRLIPVMWHKDFESASVRPSMSKLNWSIFENKGFDQAFSELLDAIKKDLEYVKFHTRLQNQAIEWDIRQDKDLLLRKTERKEAQQWLLDSGTKEPAPTPLQKKYIAASLSEHRKRIAVAGWLTGGITAAIVLPSVFFLTAIAGKIDAMVSSLEGNQGLDTLITGLQAGKELKEWGWFIDRFNSDLRVRATTVLHQAVFQLREHNRLEVHQKVYNVSFSPDGNLIASANADGTVGLWRSNGTLIAILKGHTQEVIKVVFNPDGQTLASASYDGTIRLWDLSQIPKESANSQDRSTQTYSTQAYSTQTYSTQTYNPQNQAIGLDKPIEVLDESKGGHTNKIYDLSFSPGGQFLASASGDDTVKVWTWDSRQSKTLRLFKTLSHSSPVYRLSFSPAGEKLATGDRDGTIKIWTCKNNFNLYQSLEQGSPVFSVVFSPDGRTIAAGGVEGQVKLWQQDGTPIPINEKHDDVVNQVVFSPDSQVLASVSNDSSVRLWHRDGSRWQDSRTQSKILRGHQASVYRVQFSPDGSTIATAGQDDTIRLWSREDGTLLDTLEGHRDEILGIAFSANDEMLASASVDGTIRLWQMYRPGKNPIQILPHDNRVYDVGFLPDRDRPDEQRIVSSGVGTIKLWRRDGTLLTTKPAYNIDEKAHDNDVIIVSLSLSSKGQMLASAGQDPSGSHSSVKLWTIEGDRITWFRTLDKIQAQVSSISFNPIESETGSRMLAIAGQDPKNVDSKGSVTLWTIEGNRITRFRTLEGTQAKISSVRFSPDGSSPDGQLLAIAGQEKQANGSSSGTVELWKLKGDRLNLFRTLKADPHEVLSASFSPDGQLLASGNTDGTVKLWKLDGTLLKTLKGHTDQVSKVSFSPNGKLLASASRDGTIRLWTREGTPLMTLKRHFREVSSISFSPDSASLVSASYDERAIVWQLLSKFDAQVLDELTEEGCQKIGDYLGSEQSNSVGEVLKTNPDISQGVKDDQLNPDRNPAKTKQDTRQGIKEVKNLCIPVLRSDLSDDTEDHPEELSAEN